MEQERASLVTLMAYASYLGSCNVAVQEISQVRKENISNEQKKKWLFTHASFQWQVSDVIGNVDRKDDGTFLTKEDLSWRGIRWSGSSEDERNRKRFFFFHFKDHYHSIV